MRHGVLRVCHNSPSVAISLMGRVATILHSSIECEECKSKIEAECNVMGMLLLEILGECGCNVM